MGHKYLIGKARDDAGYTIAEILVVLVVLGLIATLAVPSVLGTIQRARESTLRQNLTVIRTAIDEYYADHLEYPKELSVLNTAGYLRNLPGDNIEPPARSWLLEQDESGQGIVDIRSASTLVAIDGTIYSDW